MTDALFLVAELPAGEQFALTGDEGRHAAKVRRLTVGESLTVGDGVGSLADCVVSSVGADGLELRVTERRSMPAADPRLVVVQALAKGDRGELAVEIMTELGVDEIVPWAASRSITEWHGSRGEKSLWRWRRIVREAAKQSRRAWVPSVAALADTAAVAHRLGAATSFVLHEAATVPLASADLPTSGEVIIVVGPEGGISEDELAKFESASATAVRLGEPVLRTSTAGAAALAALSLRLGRWS